MDLRRQLAIIRARFPVLVLCTVLAAVAAYGISMVLPRAYEARATLVVGQSLSAINPDYNQLLVSQRLSATYAAVATTRPILQVVIQELGVPTTTEELAKHVRAAAALDSTLLTIVVEDPDPGRAAAIANAMAAQLIAASSAIQGRGTEFQASIDEDLRATQAQIAGTQAQVDALNALPTRTAAQDAQLLTLEDRLVSLRSTYVALLSFSSGSAANLLTVVEPAVAPPEPVSPRPLLNTAIAALLGLLVAGGILFLVEYLDESLRDADVVGEVTGLSTLGTIARMGGGRGRSEIYRLAALLYPRSGVAEAYRTLRTNVELASIDAPLRTLLVTSSVPGEGKSVTAANLAIVFAQADRRVLLVDADLRKPGIHVLFDLPNDHGLTTLLRSDDERLEAVAQRTEQPNLRVVTTGPLPPNPAELLASQRMVTITERLASDADIVIVDGPPLQAVTDPIVLSTLLDGSLMVIDVGVSRRRAVREAREALTRAGAHVLGVVLNRVAARSDNGFASYYGTAYGAESGVGASSPPLHAGAGLPVGEARRPGGG